MTNFDNGFNAKKQNRQTTRLGKEFQRKSKVVKHAAIQSADQRSSQTYTTRVRKPSSKTTSMTYGGTKGGKGATIYVKKAKSK